jgi:uncharacterized iron-regulated membrane protein
VSRRHATWIKVHRWVALSIGWLVAVVGTIGAVLIVTRPLDERWNAHLFQAQPAAATPFATLHDVPGAPLETVRRRLQAEFGPHASLTFRPPRTPTDTLWVRVSGPWTGTVYLHPASGREQGRRGEADGIFNFLFKLHSSLMLKETGKAILAIAALSYLLMLLTGLILWWPRNWSKALRIKLSAGPTRALFDLHRAVGAVGGLLIAMSVATGAYMAWRPIGAWISWVIGATPGATPVAAPASAKKGGGDKSVSMPLDAPVPALDELVARAHRALPGGRVGFVQVPAGAGKPVRVRFKLADEPHPNGISAVTLSPRDGTVLSVQRWTDLDPGARLVAWAYPLHTGELGGPVLEGVNFVNGVALGSLGVTGTWLWWRRRRTAGRQRAAPLGDRPLVHVHR